MTLSVISVLGQVTLKERLCERMCWCVSIKERVLERVSVCVKCVCVFVCVGEKERELEQDGSCSLSKKLENLLLALTLDLVMN